MNKTIEKPKIRKLLFLIGKFKLFLTKSFFVIVERATTSHTNVPFQVVNKLPVDFIGHISANIVITIGIKSIK